MSIFSAITSAAHTFAAWAEKALLAVTAEAPKVELVAAAILKYAGPALQTVVTVEAGGPAGAIVGKVIADAQAGLIAASGLIYDFGATPSIGSVLSSITTNLQSLLSASHITNQTSINTVTKVVTELESLILALAPPAAA